MADTLTDAETKVRSILDGIDSDDQGGEGWWETSVGADFGAARLAEVVAVVAEIDAELRVARTRLAAVQRVCDEADARAEDVKRRFRIVGGAPLNVVYTARVRAALAVTGD